jgi:hypothetical protein
MHTVQCRNVEGRGQFGNRHRRKDNFDKCNPPSYFFLKNNFNVVLPCAPKASTKCKVKLVATLYRTS